MLWDLVEMLLGGLPAEFHFLKAFGVLFVMYIFISLFKLFIDVIRSFIKGLRW